MSGAVHPCSCCLLAATCCCRLLHLLLLLAMQKPGPRSLGFGGQSGEGSEQSAPCQFGRSLEHESASFTNIPIGVTTIGYDPPKKPNYIPPLKNRFMFLTPNKNIPWKKPKTYLSPAYLDREYFPGYHEMKSVIAGAQATPPPSHGRILHRWEYRMNSCGVVSRVCVCVCDCDWLPVPTEGAAYALVCFCVFV